MKYVEDGQEHLASVIARKNSNCSRRVNWVSGTTKRHDKFLPNLNCDKGESKEERDRMIKTIPPIATASAFTGWKQDEKPNGTLEMHSINIAEQKLSELDDKFGSIKIDEAPRTPDNAAVKRANTVSKAETSKDDSKSEDSNILRMSECTTPGELSVNDEAGMPPDTGELIQPKAWKDLIVRQNKDPEHIKIEGPLDTYLNKTSLRSIAFSQHKARWKRIVDADLYSKTAQRGIPKMQ